MTTHCWTTLLAALLTLAGSAAAAQSVTQGATQAATQAATRAADSRLPAAVAEALQRAKVPDDALAAVVMPAAATGWRPGWTSGPRWQRQPDRPMQPGSTIKLVTSVVALDRLGPATAASPSC